MVSTKFLYALCFLCGALISITETKVTDLEYSLMPKLFHLDDFDRCLLYGKEALYCSVTVQLSPTNPSNSSYVWRIIQEVINNPKNYRHDRIRHGICIRDSCPQLMVNNVSFLMSNREVLEDGISKCYSAKYANLGLKGVVSQLHCETEDPPVPIDGYDRAVQVALCILVIIVAYGTYFEGMASYKTKEEYQRITETKYGQIISCFSIRRNWHRLRSTNPDTDNSLRFINGVRFYNMLLVVMAHACLLNFFSPVANPRFVETLTDGPEYMLVVNGAYAIETFFVITGVLLSYHFLIIFETHKQVNYKYIFLAFVNRYIRLTPCLLVMVALSGTWLHHWERGPSWNKTVGTEYRNCRENWWANLLYINNHYNSERLCLQQSWYLAADTQLFAIALFLIVLMWKYQNRIKLILGTSLVLSIVNLGLINYYYDLDIVIRQYPENYYSIYLDMPEWHIVYTTSYSNLSAYILGLIFGYIFYNCRNKSVFTNKFQIVIWWIVTWGLPLATIFVGVIFYQEDYVPNRLTSAIYVALARPVFALGVIIGMFGVSQNVGWLLRDFINWPPLQILGRLSYCVFLVHTTFLRAKSGMYRYPAYASGIVIFSATLENLGISYVFATILCLFVEMPVSALQKVFVPQLSKKRGQGDSNHNKGD